MDGLWGNPLSGTWRATDADPRPFPRQLQRRTRRMNQSYEDAYNIWAMNLQQRGFLNMTLKWFGDYDDAMAATTLAARKPLVDAAYSLWPKGNGDNHVKMFRQMVGAGDTQGARGLGSEPGRHRAEPGQDPRRASRISTPLIVTDMFETETAKADRKAGGYTFLFPAASHVEKAGSATNSGRVLQWRYQARTPAGNSKDDTELLLTLAYSLDKAGAFSHIASVWQDNRCLRVQRHAHGASGRRLQGALRRPVRRLPTRRGTALLPRRRSLLSPAPPSRRSSAPRSRRRTSTPPTATGTVTGSEWVAETRLPQFTTHLQPTVAGGNANSGTIWIYTGGYTSRRSAMTQLDCAVLQRVAGRQPREEPRPRGPGSARLPQVGLLVARQPPRALQQRRGCRTTRRDFFMSPDSVSRIFAPKAMPTTLYGRRHRERPGLQLLALVPFARRTDRAHDGGQPARPRPAPPRPRTCTRDASLATPSPTSPRVPDLDAKYGYNTYTGTTTSIARNGVPHQPRSTATTACGHEGRLPARAHDHPVRRALPGRSDHAQQPGERRGRARAVDRDPLG